jgi:hypothetical protein
MTQYDRMWKNASKLAEDMYKRKIESYQNKQQFYESVATILGFVSGIFCGAFLYSVIC